MRHKLHDDIEMACCRTAPGIKDLYEVGLGVSRQLALSLQTSDLLLGSEPLFQLRIDQFQCSRLIPAAAVSTTAEAPLPR
jgi:hypothetical protein